MIQSEKVVASISTHLFRMNRWAITIGSVFLGAVIAVALRKRVVMMSAANAENEKTSAVQT